jgi:RNA polymerase sigma-70 factor (ECF subfamily)
MISGALQSYGNFLSREPGRRELEGLVPLAMPLPLRSESVPPPASARSVVVQMPFTGDAVALVHALRENHPGAKAAFFQRYSRRVERIITHVLGFDAELADVLQEVFVSALGSIHSLQEPSAIEAWLSRVAALTARKVLRSRSRRAWLRRFVDSNEEERYEPAGAALDVEGRRAVKAVYAVLGRLPADERIAFALRFVDGMELTEVAAACGVSLATIKRRLQRAEHRFLANCKNYPELGPWVRGASRWQGR